MTRHEWTRFWTEPGGTVVGEGFGFMADPEIPFAGNDRLRSTGALAELVSDGRSLLLLGEPGSGKSVELRRLADRPEFRDATLLALGEFRDESRLEARLTRALESSVNDAGPLLLLDAVDEGQFGLPTAVDLILDVLRQHVASSPERRPCVVLTCRTGACPRDLPERLRASLCEVDQLELCPLRRCDVALAAHERGIDPESFLKQVTDRDSEAFAANPASLRLLLSLAKSGRIPSGKVELYTRGLLELCRQPDERQRRRTVPSAGGDPLSPEQTLALARRVAASLIFSGRAVVDLHDAADPELLPLSSMAGGEESLYGQTVAATPSALADAIAHSGLFVQFGPGMAFMHRSMAEFLAAWFIAEAGLDRVQIDSLLTSPGEDPRSFAPQLHETVAWLADLDQEYRAGVIAREPETLMRGDLQRYTDAERRAVTLGLLTRVEREELADLDEAFDRGEQRGSLIFFPRFRFYERLRYAGIKEDLEPWLVDASRSCEALEAALAIAHSNVCTPLSGPVATLALNPALPERTRIRAVHAIAEIGDDESRQAMRPLLALPAGEDPSDDYKGAALRSLWPDHLDPLELLGLLTPPKRNNYAGSYDLFFRKLTLAPSLNAANVLQALDWVAAQTAAHPECDELEHVATEILACAWRLIEAPGVLDRLAEVTLQRINDHRPILRAPGASDWVRWKESRERASEFIDEHTDARRSLVRACLERLSGDREIWRLGHLVEPAPLLRPADFEWGLNEARTTERGEGMAARLAALAQVAASLHAGVGPLDRHAHLELWLSLRDECPAVRDLWPLLSELGSSAADEAKQLHDEAARTEKAAEARAEAAEQDRVASLNELFRRSEEDDVRWFQRLTYTLHFGKSGASGTASFDLTRRPGWALLSERDQARTTALAERYLYEGPLTAPDEGGPIDPEVAAVAALHLHGVKPGWFERLPDDRRHALVPRLIEGLAKRWNEPREAIATLVQSLIEREPALTEAAIADAALKSESSDSLRAFLEMLPHPLPGELLDRLAEACERKLQESPLVLTMLPWLARHGVAAAQKLSVETLGARPGERSEPTVLEAASAISALVSDPAEAWALLRPRLEDDRAWLRGLIKMIAPDRMRGVDLGDVHRRMPEPVIGEFLEWLYTDFPLEGWLDRNTPPSTVSEWRSTLLNELTGRGTDDAVTALESLRTTVPAHDWLKRVIHSARVRRRRMAWRPCPASDLLALRQDKERRLVRSADELLDLVERSVRSWESSLRETDTVDGVWNRQHGAEKRYTPVDEGTLRDRLVAFLKRDLENDGIVLGREVVITTNKREDGVAGTRLDVLVEAMTEHEANAEGGDRAAVVIELKGCWNPEAESGLRDQLADRYLGEHRASHGLYVVGWFNEEPWLERDSRRGRGPWNTAQDARDGLADCLAEVSGAKPDIRIRTVLLDFSLH